MLSSGRKFLGVMLDMPVFNLFSFVAFVEDNATMSSRRYFKKKSSFIVICAKSKKENPIILNFSPLPTSFRIIFVAFVECHYKFNAIF